MRELTPETQKVLSDGDHIMNMVRSDGWAIARRRLFNFLIGLDSVTNIERAGKSDAELLRELGIRQVAIETIMTWIRDIEGEALRAKSNDELFREVRENDYVSYFSE